MLLASFVGLLLAGSLFRCGLNIKEMKKMKDVPYIPENVDLDSLEADQRKRLAAFLTSDITLAELIDRYDKSVKGDKVVSDDYWDIPIVLRDKFGVVRIQDANKSIEDICNKIDALEAKLRNHRHDTTKLFSSKAEF
jgi:hypothetical protein